MTGWQIVGCIFAYLAVSVVVLSLCLRCTKWGHVILYENHPGEPGDGVLGGLVVCIFIGIWWLAALVALVAGFFLMLFKIAEWGAKP